MDSAIQPSNNWGLVVRDTNFNEAKYNLGKVKTKPMQRCCLGYLGGGGGRGFREVCRGIAMCFGLGCLFACLLLYPPSLPPSLPPIFWGKYVYSTHWFLSVMCWRVPGRWTVARLPWWPPYCWGECCFLPCYLYGTYPPKYWRGVLILSYL